MGFGPSGPRILPAVPQQDQGLAQFASGIESILTKAKESRDFTQGTEEFDRIIKGNTDEEGNIDFQKSQLDVGASRDITPAMKAPFQQNLSGIQQSQQNQRKLDLEEKKISKEFEKGLLTESSQRKANDIISRVNSGEITPEQGASEAFAIPDKDIRGQVLSETGRRTDRITRIESQKEGERTKAAINQVSKIGEEIRKNADAGRQGLNAVEIGRKAVLTGETGPLSRAQLSGTLSSSDNPLLKGIGDALQTPAGQALKTSNLEQIRGSLRSTFGARPLESEFKFLIQKIPTAGTPEDAALLAFDLESIRNETDVLKDELFNGMLTDSLAAEQDERAFISEFKEQEIILLDGQFQKLKQRLEEL